MFNFRRLPKPELDPVYEAAYPLLILPFWGNPVPVRVRELSAAQVYSVGDVSLIETFQDKIRAKKTPTMEDVNVYTERQHRLCEMSLVKPSFQELMVIAGTHVNIKEIERELKSLRELFQRAPEGLEKVQLKNQYDAMELQYKFLLPPDFMAGVINYAMKINDTDIKRVTQETLLDAARMAVMGHDNPADHIPGNFTDFNREDINRRGWAEYHKWKEAQNGRGRR